MWQQYVDTWRKHSDFRGRATRAEYWIFQLFTWLGFFLIYFFVVLPLHYFVYGGGRTLDDRLMVPYVVYSLCIVLPFFSVYVRRLHDIGRSGWWILFQLIPLIGPVTLFVFTVLDSQTGENTYGPNLKKMVYYCK